MDDIYHSYLRRQSAALDYHGTVAGDVIDQSLKTIGNCKFSNRGLSSTSNSRHSCTRRHIVFLVLLELASASSM